MKKRESEWVFIVVNEQSVPVTVHWTQADAVKEVADFEAATGKRFYIFVRKVT